MVSQKELFARDPNLIYYPLIWMEGRANFVLPKEDLEALRSHLDPGGGTLFADAYMGSPAFDAAFRRFVAELLPNERLVPIPRDDDLFSIRVGADLSNAEFTKAAGGGRGFPQLEGVKIKGYWAIIYSKLDISRALEGKIEVGCKGLHTGERAEDRFQCRHLFDVALIYENSSSEARVLPIVRHDVLPLARVGPRHHSHHRLGVAQVEYLVRHSRLDVDEVAGFVLDRFLAPRPILVANPALQDIEHQLEADVDMGICDAPRGNRRDVHRSLVEPTFLALIPALYWMLFQLRQLPAARITRMPPSPSTHPRKSTSVRSSREGIAAFPS